MIAFDPVPIVVMTMGLATLLGLIAFSLAAGWLSRRPR